MDDEFEIALKEAAWLNLRYFPGIFPGGTEENHKHFGQNSLILTLNFPNTK
jgi:hypothetical protein